MAKGLAHIVDRQGRDACAGQRLHFHTGLVMHLDPAADHGLEIVIERNLDLAAFDTKKDKRVAKKIQAKIDAAASSFEKAFKAFQDAKNIDNEGSYSLYVLNKEGLISLSKLELTLDLLENEISNEISNNLAPVSSSFSHKLSDFICNTSLFKSEQ